MSGLRGRVVLVTGAARGSGRCHCERFAAEVLKARHLLPVPWVDPVDVSNAVVFLASDEARYITGTQIVIDAGLLAKV